VRRFVAFALFVSVAGSAAAAGEFAILKSVDRGGSWVRADTGLPKGSRINALGSMGGALLAGTDSGIFVSRDEGRSWSATGETGRVLALAASARAAFAGTDGRGVLSSNDGGRSWARIDAFAPRKVLSLLATRDAIYAGTDGEGLLASSDGGRTWTRMSPGLPESAQVEALAIAGGRPFAALYAKGLYAWSAGRWSRAGDVIPFALAAIGDVLIAGHNPGGLFRSEDLGASWSKAAADSLAPYPPVLAGAPVWTLASEGDLLFAGAADGIYVSEDRGATWTRARAERAPGIAFLLKPEFVLAAVTIAP